jgi:hypothetical protein
MRILTMLLFMVLLASCGAAATPAANVTTVPAAEPTAAPAAEPTAATPATDTTAAPGGSDTDMIGPSARVLAALVQQFGLDTANLQLVSAEEQEWPTPALGCPQDGAMYAQVITPGYKITFTDGTKTYAVHTDETGDQALLCDGGTPTVLTTAGS